MPERTQDRSEASMARVPRGRGLIGLLAGLAAAIAAVVVLVIVLSAVHLLPQLRNPFAETTSVRSQPVLLKSITALSRYEAASGSFQVVVDLSQKAEFLPSFMEGTQTLFIGQGNEIAYVDFSQLKGKAVQVSSDRTAVTITLPPAQLEPAVLNVKQSYVYAQQQIETAARQSQLRTEAQKNTIAMLTGMLRSLGFQQVTVTFRHASGG